MFNEQLAVLAVFVFLYSLIAGRIERSFLSGPIIFVSVGYLMGPDGFGLFAGDESPQTLRLLADLTLALFLFNDAANANLRVLSKRASVPARMLLLGLPLIIASGFVLAFVMFDVLSIYEAALVGVILAATDAALGKAVVSNKMVPVRLREGLNAESGLNDGLCVPVLLAFIALELRGTEGVEDGFFLQLLLEELGVGVLIGLVVSALACWLILRFWRAGWISSVWLQISTMAIALVCFSIAQYMHASGYIAAYSGGLLFGLITSKHSEELLHSAEGIAEVMALLTWFMFGCVVLSVSFGMFAWPIVIYAILSLTVIRMVPVFTVLTGSGESTKSKLFLGWFGPRGLASIVFAVIVLDNKLPNAEYIANIVAYTVLLSLTLHGITAHGLSKWMARQDSSGDTTPPNTGEKHD